MKVRAGNVTVRYYPTPSGPYQYWTVCWLENGHRKRQKLRTQNEAKKRAEELAEAINKGRIKQISFFDAVDLDRLRKRLPGISLESLADCWELHHTEVQDRPTIMIVSEMVESKRQAGRSMAYLRGMNEHLNHVAEMFPRLTSVTAAEAEKFLGRYNPRRRNFVLTLFRMLVKFAQQRKYLGEYTQLDSIPLAKTPGEIQIFTPEEMRKLLAATREYRLYLAVAAFSGIRQAELLRLRWSNVGPEYITVPAMSAKTAARRLVPIAPNLQEWFATRQFREGPLFRHPRGTLIAALWRIGQAIGGWRQNALRHSWCSYRLAQTQDAAKVALEAGNSPKMIFQHYRELVTPAQATEWFEICPQSVTKAKTANHETIENIG